MISTCINCKKEFRTFPSKIRIGQGKFCSRQCRSGKFNPNWGKHFSEEQKKKWSRGKRPDFIPWNKGVKLSQEHKEKIRKSLKEKFKNGYTNWIKGKIGIFKHSEETKRKMSNMRKGKTFSLETRKKLAEKNRGSNSHRWQRGITSLYEQIRHSLEYREWRKAIFERDNYTCQFCKIRGGQLQVDHWPIPFWKLIKDNQINSIEDAIRCEKIWDKSANRTLCKGCHLKTETYGWGSANKKQEMEKLMTFLAIHKAITIKTASQRVNPFSVFAFKNDSERSVN